MSILKVNKLTGIVEAPYGIKSKGNSVTVNFTVDSIGGLPDSSTAQVGDWFWDSGNEILKYYIGPGHSDSDGWINIGLTDSAGASAGSGGFYLETATRGIFTGGFQTGTYNTNFIDYVTIASPGNATDFGDLTVERYDLAGAASSTRAVFAGGDSGSALSTDDRIDYVTILSGGNAVNFGNLTIGRTSPAGVSSDTRAVWLTGQLGRNVLDYVTIASTGNATDFGDSAVTMYYHSACASPTRGVYGGGNNTNTLNYITIATTGNSLDFGDLTYSNDFRLGSCSNQTRGLFAGGTNSGGSYLNTINYITIASTGNATYFGGLSNYRSGLDGASSSTRGIFGGGDTGSKSNRIDYVAISSTGSASDFGDLTVARQGVAGTSNAHGGLS